MATALNRVLTVALLVIFGPGVAAAQSDADRQRAKDAVVMIRTQLPDGEQMGAGIIVAVTQTEAYVATANHMVRRGGRASSIELQFRSAPGRWATAQLLDFLDADLDLAAVVAPLPQNFNTTALKTNFAGSPQELRREMDVYALGYPRGSTWNLSVTPDKVANTTTSRIVFQSNFVQPGNSGGPLLDGCGRIVGMVIEADPPEATAVRIESVLDAVKSWNLPAPPSLAIANTTCGLDLSGTWKNNAGVVVRMQQSGNEFDWVVDDGSRHETARGEISGQTVRARYTGNAGNGEVQGRIVIEGNRAVRIIWDNGAIYERQTP